MRPGPRSYSSPISTLLVLVGLVVSLLGCDVGPNPQPNTATPPGTPSTTPGAASPAATARGSAVTPSPAATLAATATPFPTAAEAACDTPSVVGSLQLMDLPGNVREPVSLAMLNGRIYVAGVASDAVGVVENDRLSKVIRVGAAPSLLASDESLGRVFVVNSRTATLSMLDDHQVLATIPISNSAMAYAEPSSIAVDSLKHRLFVGLTSTNSEVVVVDTKAFTISARLPLGNSYSVGALAVDSAGDRLFVSRYDAISVFDLRTLRATDSINPTDNSYQNTYRLLVYDPPSDRLFADYYHSDATGSGQPDYRLMVFQAGKSVASIPVGAEPSDAQLVNGRLYVSNSFSNTLSVVDAQTYKTIATVDVGLAPRALLPDAAGEHLYVAVPGSFGPDVNRLEVIDLQRNRVSARIALAATVQQLLADPTRGRLYALVPSASALFISDGVRVLHETALGRLPAQMAVDPRNGRIYISDYLSNSVSVVDPDSGQVIDTRDVPMPWHADALAVDAAHDRLLVNNRTYSLGQLAPTGRFTVTGATIPYGEGIIPDRLIVNPSVARAYAIASNGIPGSNAGIVLYPFDTDGMKQLGINYDRNVTAFVLDDEAQRVYATAFHPLGYTSKLNVFDALSLTSMSALPLPAAVSALALNPHTHHLILSYVQASAPPYAPLSPLANNTVELLDTRTLGRVATMAVDARPNALAVLDDRIYIAGFGAPEIQTARDCAVSAPPAPTPTATQTPYPTEPPRPTSTTFVPLARTPVARAPTLTPTPTPQPTAQACTVGVAAWAVANFANEPVLNYALNRLGCPLAPPKTVQLAAQEFTNGAMLWRADTRKIYVIDDGNKWSVYDDTWDESQPAGGTETPPTAALRAPIRGFGKVWREKLGGPNAVIGWATEAEAGLTAELQDFSRGVAFKPNFFRGLDVLFADDGTWL